MSFKDIQIWNCDGDMASISTKWSLLRYQVKKFCCLLDSMIWWLQADTRWLPKNMSNKLRTVLNIETSTFPGLLYKTLNVAFKEAVRVRTDKANFGPSPIGLIFPVKVNHYIQCTNITFIRSNSIFFIFFETVFKVTSKLANLPWQTLKFCYKRRTLPKHSILF